MMFKKAFAVVFLANSSTLSTFVRAETLLRRPEVDDSAKIDAPYSSHFDPSIAGAEEEDPEHRSLQTGMKCRIFLSSSDYKGDLGGLKGADRKCQQLARNAGLSTSGTWKALIFSDQETCPDYDPNLYMSNCYNGYYLVNARGIASMKVATNKKHLLSAKKSLFRRIDYDERGRKVSSGTKYVWTGAIRKSSSSSTFIASDNDCYKDWDSTSRSKKGAFGRFTSTSSKFLADDDDRKCTKRARLYCVEQEYTKAKKKYRACSRD